MKDSISISAKIPWKDVEKNTYLDSIEKDFHHKTYLQFGGNLDDISLKDTSLRKSMFFHNELKPIHQDAQKFEKTKNDWLLLPFFVILFVFAYLITNSRLIFKTSISALYSKRGMSQLEREGDIYNEPIVFTIYFLQILIGSFLIYLTLSHYTEISIKPNLLFIYTVVGYMTFIISKYILIKILASVFYSKIQLNKLLLHNLLNVNMLNVAIFPLSFVYFYSGFTPLLHLAITFVLLAHSYKLIKTIIDWHKNFTIFKTFAYLCTIEILPYLLLLKLVLNLTN